MRATLYILGAAFELFGIILVASPDLVPGARRFSRWIAPRWRRFENRLRRLLRLPGRNIVVDAGAATLVLSAGSVSAVTSVNDEATLERKVDFLLRRDQEAQRQTNELAQRLSSMESELVRRHDELRGQMEEHVSTKLDAAFSEYRAARVIGTGLLAIGLTLTTIGSFVG